MKLSFLPGDLHLFQNAAGEYVVQHRGNDLLTTASDKAALRLFNEKRKELVKQFPKTELTQEQEREAEQRLMRDRLVPHNPFLPEKKGVKKGSTRTFG